LKKVKIVLFLAAALALALPAIGNAYTWFSYGGHTYALTNNAEPWLTAEAEAVTQGGHLVTINNAAEESWLSTTFGTTNQLYIGFTDQAVEGTWVWISGEPVTYTNWASGEPNNFTGEDYAVMNSFGIQWNDLHGGGNIYGIIEVSPQVIPLPPSALLLGSGLLGLGAVGWRLRRKE
jgi:hypothetical protein